MKNKSRLFWLLIFPALQLGCYKKPTYNPFDKEFKISIRQVVNDGCDTLSAGCGYFNLCEKSTPSSMYYQIYDQSFYEVVAKGFVYHIDTFRIENFEDYYNDSTIKDSIINVQLPMNELNNQIGKYNYSYLDKIDKTIRIVNPGIQDTISLRFNLVETNRINYFVRNLEYYIGIPDD